MKERIYKNKITTGFGILIWIATLALITLRIIGKSDIGTWDIVLLAFLGWIFFVAKDSILEGITMKIFNSKPEGQAKGADEITDVKP